MGVLRTSIRAVLTDPPIGDRLLWRGMLRPSPEEESDRALPASAFGALYAVGGVLALLALAAGVALVDDAGLLATGAGAALVVSVVCLVGYRRLPQRSFDLVAAAGIGMVTLVAISGEDGSEAVYAPLYVFIVMLAFLLFRARPAAVQAALAVIAYGLVLHGNDAPFANELLLSLALMLVALGAVIGVMRTRGERIANELTSDAYTDKLTRLPNRRAFDERLRLELARADRSDQPVALLIADLDHFKRVNDTVGHEAGDAALQRTGRVLAQRTRAVDLTARIGGEEFGVVLPGASAEDASAAAERIRNGVRTEFERDRMPLTISCGIAAAGTGEPDLDSLFEQADRALYAAKDAGRNCTAIAEDGGTRIVAGGSTVGRLRQLF